MEGERIIRLPLNDPQRIRARDAKLQLRDADRAQRHEMSRIRCPCNLCGGRRRPYKLATVARHLMHRGRHGALRGWTEVNPFHKPCCTPSVPLESTNDDCTRNCLISSTPPCKSVIYFFFSFRVTNVIPRTRSGTNILDAMPEPFLAFMSPSWR